MKQMPRDLTTLRVSTRDPQHGLDGSTSGRILRGPIDTGKIVEGNHALDRHLPSHEQVDEPGDELLRAALALDHAVDNAAELQEGHFEGDLRAAARAAEKNAGAGRHERVDGFSQDRWLRRGFERETHAQAARIPPPA